MNRGEIGLLRLGLRNLNVESRNDRVRIATARQHALIGFVVLYIVFLDDVVLHAGFQSLELLRRQSERELLVCPLFGARAEVGEFVFGGPAALVERFNRGFRKVVKSIAAMLQIEQAVCPTNRVQQLPHILDRDLRKGE